MHFCDLSRAFVASLFKLALLHFAHSQCFEPVALFVFEFLVASLGDHATDVRLDNDRCPKFHTVLTSDQISSTTALMNNKLNIAGHNIKSRIELAWRPTMWPRRCLKRWERMRARTRACSRRNPLRISKYRLRWACRLHWRWMTTAAALWRRNRRRWIHPRMQRWMMISFFVRTRSRSCSRNKSCASFKNTLVWPSW